MRVSELAERSGVAASTLRYYEERGLLAARRSPAGYRLYDKHALQRLAFITGAKRLGLGLAEIGELTRVWAERPCSEVKAVLRPRLADRWSRARQQGADLESFQTLLTDELRRLDALPDRDVPCDPVCAFPDTGSPAPAQSASYRTFLPVVNEAPTCSLERSDYRQRMIRWRRLLQQAIRTSRPQGSSWSLPLSQAGPLAELAAAEGQCCSFLRLRIDFTAHRVHLHASLDPQHRAPEPGTAAWEAAHLLGALDNDSAHGTEHT